MELYIGYSMMSVAGFLGWYLCRRKKGDLPISGYLLVLGIVALLCLIAAVWEENLGNGEAVEELKRQELGDQQVMLSLETDGVSSGRISYPVIVEEQRMTELQKRQLMETAIAELEQVFWGGQGETQAISADLTIPSVLQEGRVQAAFTFWPSDVIDMEGVIHWENFNDDEPLVEVSVLLECQETELIHEFYLQLERPSLSESESFYAELEEQLGRQNQKTDTEHLVLPQEILGTRVAWYQEKERSHWKILLLGVIGMLLHYIVRKSQKNRQRKQWHEGLIMDYPDIVSRLSLLVGAGMTVSGAIGKLASEYQKGRAESRRRMQPGYEELLRTWNEIQDGTGERKAYENFGVRCSQHQYRKLSSLLIQNVRKGAKGMQQLLDAEVAEVYLQQQAYVKQRGEEAAAKLLLPMGIMLMLVFAILIVPAMFSMQY